jgi:hypothetical protein
MEQPTESKKNIYLIDIRNVLIIFLILFCIWMFFNPFGTNRITELENDNKLKQDSIDILTRERDSIQKQRGVIDVDIVKLQVLAKNRKDTIEFYKRLSKSKDIEIRDLKENISVYDEMIRRTEEQIDRLMKNPIILPKNKIVEKTAEKIK